MLPNRSKRAFEQIPGASLLSLAKINTRRSRKPNSVFGISPQICAWPRPAAVAMEPPGNKAELDFGQTKPRNHFH